MKLRLSQLYVNDQEKALAFYRDKLGLIVSQDESYGPDARWLSVVFPDDQDGVALLLSKCDSANGSEEYQQKQYAADKPVLSIAVDDLQATFDELTAKGVRFRFPPTEESYGGKNAVAEDTCGNLINFNQS